MFSKSERIILVTGATGRQGGAVADCLLESGWTVNALTRGRSPGAVETLKRKGAHVVIGDLNDRASLDKALTGVYGVFLVTAFMEDGTDKEIIRGKNMVDAARDAGVKHFIFSSVGAAGRDTKIPHFESKREIELYIRKRGLLSTIFRPVSFMYNYDMPETRKSIMNGKFRSYTAPDKKVQLLAQEDLGAYVNLAFERPEYFAGKEIELAGEELTSLEIADVFSRALGIKISYEEIPAEDIRKMGEDRTKMVDFMNKYGYDADIKKLRKLYPNMMTLERWLKLHKWDQLIARKAA